MDQVTTIIKSNYKYQKGGFVQTSDIKEIFETHNFMTNPIIYLNRTFSQTFKFSKTKKLIRNLARRTDQDVDAQTTPKKSKVPNEPKLKKINDDQRKSKEKVQRERKRKRSKEFKTQLKSKKDQTKRVVKKSKPVNSTPRRSSIKIKEKKKGEDQDFSTDEDC